MFFSFDGLQNHEFWDFCFGKYFPIIFFVNEKSPLCSRNTNKIVSLISDSVTKLLI